MRLKKGNVKKKLEKVGKETRKDFPKNVYLLLAIIA
jgi:hypothetical protein